jgi:hypothetical protein
MKKLFFAAVLSVFTSMAALAHDVRDNSMLSKLFKAEYPEAKDIRWKTTNSYTSVSFVLHNERLQVFYSNDGTKMGTSRSVQLQQLPPHAQKIIGKRYADYKVTEAIEFDQAQDGIIYYVSLKDTRHNVVLQVSALGEVSEFRKTKL